MSEYNDYAYSAPGPSTGIVCGNASGSAVSCWSGCLAILFVPAFSQSR